VQNSHSPHGTVAAKEHAFDVNTPERLFTFLLPTRREVLSTD
jgi:hypothetical protein